MTDECPHSQQHCLNELEATAICGNDITSSCLYVSALTILQAGKWAPLALLIVAAVLFLYRKIYAEVVGALPLNGGARLEHGSRLPKDARWWTRRAGWSAGVGRLSLQ